MKTLLILILSIAFLQAQTIKEDFETLLAINKMESVEVTEYIKSRIDEDFIAYALKPLTNPKRLILEYIAEYLDATIVYDGKGWDRLLPEEYQLYHCEVYSLNNRLNFDIPAQNDENAYSSAEDVFNRHHREKVVKIHINEINTKKVHP